MQPSRASVQIVIILSSSVRYQANQDIARCWLSTLFAMTWLQRFSESRPLCRSRRPLVAGEGRGDERLLLLLELLVEIVLLQGSKSGTAVVLRAATALLVTEMLTSVGGEET